MSRPVPLDTSFLIALERETARNEIGPARTFLPSLRGRRLVVSIVNVEELLEGAVDEAALIAGITRFTIVGLLARTPASLSSRSTLALRS